MNYDRVCVFSFVYVWCVWLCVRNVDVGKSFLDHTWREIVTGSTIKHIQTHKCTKLAKRLLECRTLVLPILNRATISRQPESYPRLVRNVFFFLGCVSHSCADGAQINNVEDELRTLRNREKRELINTQKKMKRI